MPTRLNLNEKKTVTGAGRRLNLSGKKPKKKGGGFLGSVGGFVGNAAGDVRDLAVGIGPGLYETGKAVSLDTRDFSRAIGHREGGDFTPSRTSNLGKAIGKQYADTYGPLFQGDFGKFAHNLYEHPLGPALDVATVASGGAAGAAKAGLIASKGGKVLDITTPSGKVVRKPLARGELRAQTQAASVKARERVSPGSAAAKEKRKQLARKDAGRRAGIVKFNRELSKLRGKPARAAAFLRAQFDRQALDEYVATLREGAEKRPNGTEAKALRIITSPRVQELFDRPTKQIGNVVSEARGVGKKQQAMLGVSDQGATSRAFLPARIAGGARWDDKLKEWVGGPTDDELVARGLDPTYLPHTSTGKGATVDYYGRGGGKGIPTTTGNTRQNRGSLMLSGQIIQDPAVLNTSFLKAAKYTHYKDVHEALLEMAVPSSTIPRGYQAVRRSRGEHVSPRDKTRSDFDEWADDFLDDDGQWKSGENGLTTRGTDDAISAEDGRYLIVPDRIVRQLTGEFVQQGKVLRWIERHPTRVWRALVLNVRPAYLVNNVVGNTLLYLMHSAKPQDLRELAGAFKQFASPSEGKQIDRLLDKHFAGQVHGGFIATQGYGGKLGASSRAKAVVNVIPAMDRRWEQALRRAKVKSELRKHPELRAKAERMGTDTEYFEKVEKILDRNPDIVNQVYDRVNDALGNYDTLSAVERNKLRSLFPFYAWYKAISGVTGKLVIDQPLKANLVSQLGRIAMEQNLASSGLSAEISGGLIPFGKDEDGRVRGFNTTPMNPWATVGALADFVTSPARGAGALAANQPGIGPVPFELYSFITGRTPEGYPADAPFRRTVEGLPWFRLQQAKRGTGPQGDTLNDRDIIDELLRYLGVPYARRSRSADERVRERKYG